MSHCTAGRRGWGDSLSIQKKRSEGEPAAFTAGLASCCPDGRWHRTGVPREARTRQTPGSGGGRRYPLSSAHGQEPADPVLATAEQAPRSAPVVSRRPQ